MNNMPVSFLVHFFALIWLSVCSWLDWKTRQVPNWLTIPVLFLALLMRLSGQAVGPWQSALSICVLVLGLWAAGVGIGGADAKITAALALFDPALAAWAWMGVVSWYLAVLLVTFGRQRPYKLPGVVGFLLGILIYLTWRIWL